MNKNLLDQLYKLKFEYGLDFTDIYNKDYEDLEILESNLSNILQDIDLCMQYIEEEYENVRIE
ncbi:MAG: hypothetical protein KC589_09840 [Nanoarchaeota archaeon]|nr:hypothetical protein [Nanoarchaeota archaeon]